MATHHFQPTYYHTAIGSHPPVLHIAIVPTTLTVFSSMMLSACTPY
jgi:hypothetical protein